MKKNKITIISPKIRYPVYDLNTLLFHEINHIFYTSIVGSYHPVWFSEGIATYLMGAYKFDEKKWKEYFSAIKKPERFLYYRFRKKEYYKNSNNFYVLSYLTYKYLSKKYGDLSAIKLLKKFSKNKTKDSFEKTFLKEYGLTVKKVMKHAISQ